MKALVETEVDPRKEVSLGILKENKSMRVSREEFEEIYLFLLFSFPLYTMFYKIFLNYFDRNDPLF